MPDPRPAPATAVAAPRLARVARLLGASALAVSALAVSALAGCRGADASARPAGAGMAGDSVAIGVALDPTSPWAASMYDGATLAIEQLNARRGARPPFALRRTPDGMTSAVRVATLMRDDAAVVGVVGHPESGPTLEALPIFEDVEGGGRRAVAAVSPTASSPALSGRSAWLFRICPTDLVASAAVARYVVDSLGARRAAVVYLNDSYGRDWARAFDAAFRALGGTVVQRDPYVPDGMEWRAYAAYMKQQRADVVLFPGDPADAVLLLRALRAEGADLAFVGGDAASGLEEHAEEFAGARYTAFYDARYASTPTARAFVDAFRARFGRVPDQEAALAYDAAMLIGRAALDVGPDRRRVRDALAAVDSTRRVEGATGPIAFDARHDVVGKPVVIATVGAR